MKIIVDFLEAGQHKSIEASATRLFKRMVKCKAKPGNLNCQELIWPSLNKVDRAEPELVLVPLNRVGAEQGFGGSYVMIGYFVDHANRIYPSNPLVVKVSRPTKKDKAKLKSEWDSGVAIRSYITYHNDSFAVPLQFDDLPDQQHAVLWSPFSSSEWIWSKLDTRGKKLTKRLTLQVSDLWRVLRQNYVDMPASQKCNAIEVLENVYRVMKPLHDRVGTVRSKKKRIVEEYDWYLRGFNKKAGWGKRICAMWKGQTVKEQGLRFYNPILCLDKLRNHVAKLRCGAVHGDLHPRNIVLAENNEPHIIDFGWAADKKHIAKDFVLMECNLRFVALQPDIESKNLNIMASWIGFDDKPQKTSSEECAKRIELIQELRKIARSRFPQQTNWDEEYIIPLFLISFGLLRVLSSMDNQMAARTTVLELSAYLKKRLKF